MRTLIIALFSLSFLGLNAQYLGTGSTAESAFINAFYNMNDRSQIIEYREGSETRLKGLMRLDTSIGNLHVVVQFRDESKMVEENTTIVYVEEMFEIRYSDEDGNLFQKEFSLRCDHIQSNVSCVEEIRSQTTNMTFEKLLELLKTQGFEIQHSTEKYPFESDLEERFHKITIEYKKP